MESRALVRSAVLLAAALGVVTATTPAAVRAATVSAKTTHVPGDKGSGVTTTDVLVVAAPGERNAIAVRAVSRETNSASAVHVSDGGAPLIAAAGCRPEPGGVVCAASRRFTSASVTVEAGDGDDVVTTSGHASFSVDGGPGADRLAGGGGGDTLRGGDGDDVLSGGAGDDTLDGGPGADLLAGGPGAHDTVTYAARVAPVTATIGTSAGNGEAREDDAIAADVENLTGGSGGDQLTGDDRANTLIGSEGSDRIDGRGGDDQLSLDTDGSAAGGPGDDVLSANGGARLAGGPGRDRFNLQGLAATTVTADDDADGDIVMCLRRAAPTVLALGPGDVSAFCGAPAVRRSGGTAPALAIASLDGLEPVGAHPSLGVNVICADDARRPCRTRVTLRAYGAGVGDAVRVVAPGAQRTVSVPLSATLIRRLRRDHYRDAFRLSTTATMRDARGRMRADRVTACVAGGELQFPNACR
jgi:Ca2+-binding RTX toxin-like protein